MAKPVWNVLNTDPVTAFNDVMENGGFVGTMTDAHFSLGHGDNTIVFDGQFTLDAGVIVDGTITGFSVYAGAEHLLSASGYAIDFNDLGSALESYRDFDDPAPLGNLISAHGIVVNDHSGSLYLGGTAFGDIFYGNGGADHFEGLAGADEMHGGAGGDGLEGGNGADKLYGDSGGDTLYGEAGNDQLFGGKGADRLSGGLNNDILKGGAGDDHLNGDAGADVLAGGGGNDTFAFNGEFAAGMPVDHITDYVHGVDLIELDGSAANLPVGALGKAAFYAGPEAHDADDRIVYNKAKGALYYDPDGKGGEDQVKFAVLDGHPSLGYHDFVVVA
jgi:Ca2+-binding RTX toxin-like protein